MKTPDIKVGQHVVVAGYPLKKKLTGTVLEAKAHKKYGSRWQHRVKFDVPLTEANVYIYKDNGPVDDIMLVESANIKNVLDESGEVVQTAQQLKDHQKYVEKLFVEKEQEEHRQNLIKFASLLGWGAWESHMSFMRRGGKGKPTILIQADDFGPLLEAVKDLAREKVQDYK